MTRDLKWRNCTVFGTGRTLPCQILYKSPFSVEVPAEEANSLSIKSAKMHSVKLGGSRFLGL